MERTAAESAGPGGGLQTSPKLVRKWRWNRGRGVASEPVRCRREQWYLLRGVSANGRLPAGMDVVVEFLSGDELLAERCVALDRVADGRSDSALLGWLESPEKATHLRVRLASTDDGLLFDRLVLHPVAERDPKCHPHANVPRWSAYAPPFEVKRVVWPDSLARLADCVPELEARCVKTPRSRAALAKLARRTACVISPQWVRTLGLRLDDLERLARNALVLVDLQTLADLVEQSGRAATKAVTYTSSHQIMSARVDYADVATRGFALQDVVPYCTVHDECKFQTRVLRATRSWKRYAGDEGFATLLASETPWATRCGDVLSASRPVDRGELIATDLPWLVAGAHGRLLAPRLGEHLLRMHLGLPLDDWIQYWNRWDDGAVVLRDLADLTGRYAPLKAVRWASDRAGVAHLALTLPPIAREGTLRHLVIRTGRIDSVGAHGGVAPEPLAIFIKQLARETRQRTALARRLLKGTYVTWQFDTADGLRYATRFDSAAALPESLPTRVLNLQPTGGAGGDLLEVSGGAGIHGDGSLTYQAELTRGLLAWIAAAAG